MSEMTNELTRFKYQPVEVKREGKEIVLPALPYPMTYEEVIDFFVRLIHEENMEVEIDAVIEGFPYDAARALHKAIEKIFGVPLVGSSTVKGPFGSYEAPPKTVDVEVAYGKYEAIMWGGLSIPGVKGKLDVASTVKDGVGALHVTGMTLKKFENVFHEVIAEARKILKTDSLYRGSAWVVPLDAKGNADFASMGPRFFNLTASSDPLILSDHVMEQIDYSLFTPIRHTEMCRSQKIPLKRGILLEGKFGTGKTLTARLTAEICVENGWTFILVPNAKALPSTLEMAKRTSTPAVVFVEDVDRVTDGERSESMDNILNTIDGIGSKNTEVITVLTTNNLSNIHRAMLRPGRIDALITIEPPDAKATEKLLRHYGAGLIKPKTNIAEASEAVQGNIPAFIREVIERAKLAAVSREPTIRTDITNSDLMIAVRSLQPHLDIMGAGTVEAPATIGSHFDHMNKRIDETAEKVDALYENV